VGRRSQQEAFYCKATRDARYREIRHEYPGYRLRRWVLPNQVTDRGRLNMYMLNIEERIA